MFIEVINICDWAGENTDQRKYIEGERIFQAGHVILCGIKENTESGGVKVTALCLQTSHLKDKPHEVNVEIDEHGTILNCHCNGKAGESKQCKHILSTLLYIYYSDELPFLSSTDMECEWKKIKNVSLKQYEPKKFHTHECMKKKINLGPSEPDYDVSLSEEQKRKLIELALELSDSAFAKHKTGRHGQFQLPEISLCTPEELEAIIKIFNLQENKLMKIIQEFNVGLLNECCSKTLASVSSDYVNLCLESKEYCDIWMKEKTKRITDTNCYDLSTYLKNKTPNWPKKLKRSFYPLSISSTFIEHGNNLEDQARRCFIQSTNNLVFCTGLVVSQQNPWLACSPDGVIFKDNQPHALLQIKCPSEGATECIENTVQASLKTFLVYDDKKNIVLKTKHTYYGEVQLGMSIINVSCDILIL
uniref:SWIM-type domain-containing protein n=1 Tax=Trichogramma kaykai TaxID=54128 RepID=A0ABD2WU95_9HYME